MGDAIESDAAVSLIIPLVLILGIFLGLVTASSWVQVCRSNRSVSRRRRRAAFLMSGEKLLLSQCAFCFLWLPGTCESSTPGLRHPPPPHPRLWLQACWGEGGSWLRCMSQVPRQGVKRAAEVNKSRAYERPVTTCCMSRPDDSITGYVGHMVPLVTVKLIPFESQRQHGKLLGGAQEVLPKVGLRLQEFYRVASHTWGETWQI